MPRKFKPPTTASGWTDCSARASMTRCYGVLNGIDVDGLQPRHRSGHGRQNIPPDDLERQGRRTKRKLQEKLGLKVDPDIPIIGMVGRLSNQKGLDLVDCVIGGHHEREGAAGCAGHGRQRAM